MIVVFIPYIILVLTFCLFIYLLAYCICNANWVSGKNYHKLVGIYAYEGYRHCGTSKARISLCNVIDLTLGTHNMCKCINCKVHVIHITQSKCLSCLEYKFSKRFKRKFNLQYIVNFNLFTIRLRYLDISLKSFFFIY